MDLLADRFTCPLRVLSICSGIGGASLGLSLALGKHHVTVCHVEREASVASILAARMEEGRLDPAPIFSSLQSFDPKPWRGAVDLIVSTAPCQSYSVAGKRQGSTDKEKHLWPYIAEIIKDIRPALFFLENVPGIVNTALPEICQDLYQMAYSIAAGIFSADECGASHVRKRFFLLASDSDGRSLRLSANSERKTARGTEVQSSCDGETQFMADADGAWQLQSRRRKPEKRRRDFDSSGTVAYAESTRRPKRDGQMGLHCTKGRIVQQPQRSNSEGGRIGESNAVGEMGDLAARLSEKLAEHWGEGWEAGTPRVAVNQTHKDIKLRALGNAVVPATACKAFLCLLQQHIDGDNLLSALND